MTLCEMAVSLYFLFTIETVPGGSGRGEHEK